MRKNIFFTLLVLIIILPCAAQEGGDAPYLRHLNAGKEFYENSRYTQAIQEFNKAAELSPSHMKSQVYLLLGYSYMALGQNDKASGVFDFIISTYPGTPDSFESLYQNGRLSFISGNYELSINILTKFLETAEEHPLRGNAFFWIAESLYNLGHIDEATGVYHIVKDKYKQSYKYEAAIYRLEIINLSKRERELSKLLKWSNEQALNQQTQFSRKEKELNQAIQSYQQKLSTISLSEKDEKILHLTETNNTLRKQIEVMEDKINSLSSELETLNNKTQNSSSGI